MGWLFGKGSRAEYRLLDRQTPSDGMLFWVRDGNNAEDVKFINKMLLAYEERMPPHFRNRLMASDKMRLTIEPSSEGGFEVHINF